MKKKVFAVLTCAVFVMAMAAGCGGKKDPAPEKDPVDQPVAQQQAEKPAEEELLQKYEAAAEVYADINLGMFTVDPEASIMDGDYMYHRIVDERFESYEEFRSYLGQFFTAELVEEELLDDSLFLEGKDGCLYVLDASRGMNIFYAGYSVGEPVMTEDEIILEVTAYYTEEEPYMGEYFTEVPEDAEEYETETYRFALVEEDGAWKFESFSLLY